MTIVEFFKKHKEAYELEGLNYFTPNENFTEDTIDFVFFQRIGIIDAKQKGWRITIDCSLRNGGKIRLFFSFVDKKEFLTFVDDLTEIWEGESHES